MLSIEDMADLIFLCDTYKELSKALFGGEMIFTYREGPFGKLSKVFDIVERNVVEELKENDNKKLWEIVEDTSKTAEERAKLLLHKNVQKTENYKKGDDWKREVHMEKFKFNRKLQEAVLRRKEGQHSAIIIDGEEIKVRCPAFVGAGIGDIPCLVEEDNKVGNAGYTVVVVSFNDLDAEEKNWVCIQPMLIEQSIGFFIENHQMEDMVRDYGNISRLTDARDAGFDFETESACIEIKVPVPVTDGTDICIWKGFHQAVKQMVGFSSNFAVKEKGKRIILLTICQDGTEQLQSMADGNIEEELKKAAKAGIEFWTAETKIDPDGVELLSYCDITCNLLNG